MTTVASRSLGPASPTRLAVVATHPVQYYAPWFRHLAARDDIDLRVFYLWDFGVAGHTDPRFLEPIVWDVPLLDGYASEFVPNRSPSPGTHSPAGLWNPELVARVRAWRPDAVLLMAYNYASLYWFVTRWHDRSAPLLFRGDSHRLVASRSAGARLRGQVTRRIFRRFDACLYVGQANRRYFLDHDVPAERLHFSPHAVDNARFIAASGDARREAMAWRASLGIPRDHRVVLFAGKLEEKKRPLDLLRAFVEARLERASLLFVGAGPLEGTLREAARMRTDVHFAPFQNQSRMPTVYAAGDLFVLPSYGPSETWGLAVNEAQCLARPVVVSSHVGCAEDLVEPGVNGLVFPAGDVDALANALRDALSDDTRLAAWGHAGRERVAEYSYERASAGLLDALDRVGRARTAVRPHAAMVASL